MTNRWEVSGIIGDIEPKTSKAGKDYWIVNIESGEHMVPVTVFSQPPPKGIEVKAIGKVSSYNGYAKLIDAKLEAYKPLGNSQPDQPAPQHENAEPFDPSLPF